MATSEYIERFRYNDGEGIEFPDFNDQQTLVRRTFHGDVNGLVHGDPWTTSALPLSAPVCRPIGDALLPVLNAGTADVRVNNGGLYFAPVADPGTPDQHVLFHRLGGQTAGTPPANTFAVSTSSASGGGAGDRNDLLTAQVIEVNNAADDEPRDFEDAVTGQLSSNTPNKRFRTQLELLVVEGVEGAGDPAVAADVVTIARYIMRDGAAVYTAADIEDLRQSDWRSFVPTITGVAAADISINDGQYKRDANVVLLVLDIAWNNAVNDPASNLLDVEISLPLQAANLTGAPQRSYGRADLPTSLHPQLATDGDLHGIVQQDGTFQGVVRMERISTGNAFAGLVAVGNTSRRIALAMRYFTDGVFLIS